MIALYAIVGLVSHVANKFQNYCFNQLIMYWIEPRGQFNQTRLSTNIWNRVNRAGYTRLYACKVGSWLANHRRAFCSLRSQKLTTFSGQTIEQCSAIPLTTTSLLLWSSVALTQSHSSAHTQEILKWAELILSGHVIMT